MLYETRDQCPWNRNGTQDAIEQWEVDRLNAPQSAVTLPDLESRLGYSDSRHRARVIRAAKGLLRELQRRQDVLTSPLLKALQSCPSSAREDEVIRRYGDLGSLMERIEKEVGLWSE